MDYLSALISPVKSNPASISPVIRHIWRTPIIKSLLNWLKRRWGRRKNEKPATPATNDDNETKP